MSKFMGEGFNMKDFMDFKFFVAPQIIKAIWIVTSIIGGFAWVIGMCNACDGFGIFLSILFGLPLLLLVIRLFFESFMVLFAMVALLRDLRDKQQ